MVAATAPPSFLLEEGGSEGRVSWAGWHLRFKQGRDKGRGWSRDGGGGLRQVDNLVPAADISWWASQHAFPSLGRASQFCFGINHHASSII